MMRDMRRSGEDEAWREGAADRKLWKEWFNNTVSVPDPHPCTAGFKEEEHTTHLHMLVYEKFLS